MFILWKSVSVLGEITSLAFVLWYLLVSMSKSNCVSPICLVPTLTTYFWQCSVPILWCADALISADSQCDCGGKSSRKTPSYAWVRTPLHTFSVACNSSSLTQTQSPLNFLTILGIPASPFGNHFILGSFIFSSSPRNFYVSSIILLFSCFPLLVLSFLYFEKRWERESIQIS